MNNFTSQDNIMNAPSSQNLQSVQSVLGNTRIQDAFNHGKAFIPFITCGDPDLETTAKIVRAMAENGADLIELGIPFSDPTAEGPVIQDANLRALSAGATTDKIFDLVRELRAGGVSSEATGVVGSTCAGSGSTGSGSAGSGSAGSTCAGSAGSGSAGSTCAGSAGSGSAGSTCAGSAGVAGSACAGSAGSTCVPGSTGSALVKPVTIPMVFMTYANVVFSYGAERFIRICSEIGIDGMILPDIPYEEKEEFSALCAQYGVALISMIAPTSENRIAMIAREATGFIYIVSSLGVTGVRSEITTDISALVNIIRDNTSVPCAVGFGISTPEQAHKMAAFSDGAIVGSAIIRLIAKYGRDAADPVGEYVKSMKESL